MERLGVLQNIAAIAVMGRDILASRVSSIVDSQPPASPPRIHHRRLARPKLPLPRAKSLKTPLEQLGLTPDITTRLCDAYRRRIVSFSNVVKKELKDLWGNIRSNDRYSENEAIERYSLAAKIIHSQYAQGVAAQHALAILAVRAHFHIPENSSVNGKFDERFVCLLEWAFEYDRYPSQDEKRRMARASGLSYRQISVWFQNRRTRVKKKEKSYLEALERGENPAPPPVHRFRLPPPAGFFHRSPRTSEVVDRSGTSHGEFAEEPISGTPSQDLEYPQTPKDVEETPNPLDHWENPEFAYPKPSFDRIYDAPSYAVAEWPHTESIQLEPLIPVNDRELDLLGYQMERIEVDPPEHPDVTELCEEYAELRVRKLPRYLSPNFDASSGGNHDPAKNSDTSSETQSDNDSSVNEDGEVLPNNHPFAIGVPFAEHEARRTNGAINAYAMDDALYPYDKEHKERLVAVPNMTAAFAGLSQPHNHQGDTTLSVASMVDPDPPGFETIDIVEASSREDVDTNFLHPHEILQPPSKREPIPIQQPLPECFNIPYIPEVAEKALEMTLKQFGLDMQPAFGPVPEYDPFWQAKEGHPTWTVAEPANEIPWAIAAVPEVTLEQTMQPLDLAAWHRDDTDMQFFEARQWENEITEECLEEVPNEVPPNMPRLRACTPVPVPIDPLVPLLDEQPCHTEQDLWEGCRPKHHASLYFNPEIAANFCAWELNAEFGNMSQYLNPDPALWTREEKEAETLPEVAKNIQSWEDLLMHMDLPDNNNLATCPEGWSPNKVGYEVLGPEDGVGPMTRGCLIKFPESEKPKRKCKHKSKSKSKDKSKTSPPKVPIPWSCPAAPLATFEDFFKIVDEYTKTHGEIPSFESTLDLSKPLDEGSAFLLRLERNLDPHFEENRKADKYWSDTFFYPDLTLW